MVKKKAKKKIAKKKIVKKKSKKKGEKPRLTYDEIEWIKALLVINTSMREVARQTGRSVGTIKRISDVNEDEIEQYRTVKKKEFIFKAWEKIFMLLDLVTQGKCYFATVSQITTAMGTIYDKAALAGGEATDRIHVHKYDESKLSDLSIDELIILRGLLSKMNTEK